MSAPTRSSRWPCSPRMSGPSSFPACSWRTRRRRTSSRCCKRRHQRPTTDQRRPDMDPFHPNTYPPRIAYIWNRPSGSRWHNRTRVRTRSSTTHRTSPRSSSSRTFRFRSHRRLDSPPHSVCWSHARPRRTSSWPCTNRHRPRSKSLRCTPDRLRRPSNRSPPRIGCSPNRLSSNRPHIRNRRRTRSESTTSSRSRSSSSRTCHRHTPCTRGSASRSAES